MEIKNCDRLGEGKGLFTTKVYKKGTIVHTLMVFTLRNQQNTPYT